MKVDRAEFEAVEGAEGFSLATLNEGRSTALVRVDVAHLQAGCEIPRHKAGREQTFYIVSGTGRVAGQDCAEVRVNAGDTVTWSEGEEHRTVAVTDLTAVIVQRSTARGDSDSE